MVEVRTVYTIDTYSKFLKFCFFRGKYSRIGHMFYRGLEVVLVILFFVFLLGPWSIPYPPFIFLLVAVFLYVAQEGMPVIMAKSYKKKAEGLFTIGLELVFKKNIVNIKSIGADEESTTKMPYDKVRIIYETQDAFYFFIVHGQELVFPKSDIVRGTADDLRDIVKVHMGRKSYIVCK